MSLFFRYTRRKLLPRFFEILRNTCLSATNPALILQAIHKTDYYDCYDSELKAMTNNSEKESTSFPKKPRSPSFTELKSKYFGSEMISATSLFIIVSVKHVLVLFFIFFVQTEKSYHHRSTRNAYTPIPFSSPSHFFPPDPWRAVQKRKASPPVSIGVRT